MTGQNQYGGFLRQLASIGGAYGQSRYPLSTTQSTVIGREPSCQIVLDDNLHKGVSRRHTEVRPLAGGQSPYGLPVWQICDLNSANGTYVNKQRLRGCQNLQNGDHIQLDQNGPEFIFECQPANTPTPYLNIGVVPPTVYNPHVSPQSPAQAPSQNDAGFWKTLGGIGAVIVAIALFNYYQTLQQPSQPPQATAPPTAPAPPQTAPNPELIQTPSNPTEPTPASEGSEVQFRGTELLDEYFIGSNLRVKKNVQIQRPSGETVVADIYVFDVESRTDFDSNSVQFFAHFYNSEGMEISKPSLLLYNPDHQHWSPGTKSTAIFGLGSNDSSSLRFIEFTH